MGNKITLTESQQYCLEKYAETMNELERAWSLFHDAESKLIKLMSEQEITVFFQVHNGTGYILKTDWAPGVSVLKITKAYYVQEPKDKVPEEVSSLASSVIVLNEEVEEKGTLLDLQKPNLLHGVMEDYPEIYFSNYHFSNSKYSGLTVDKCDPKLCNQV